MDWLLRFSIRPPFDTAALVDEVSDPEMVTVEATAAGSARMAGLEPATLPVCLSPLSRHPITGHSWSPQRHRPTRNGSGFLGKFSETSGNSGFECAAVGH